MEPTHGDDLVTVSAGGSSSDGIVFDTPSSSKVVVAVMDPHRGPVFRTVHPTALAKRTDAGPDDQALRLLIRRSPAPVQRGARGTTRAGQGRAGYTRGATHRSTGR